MDNIEGSQAIFQTFLARKNLKLCVSKQQMYIILGSILGDAYIYPQGKICFEQGEKQKEYLLWKYTQLKTLAYPKIAQVTRLDKPSQRTTTSWRFFLRQYFRPLRQVFYVKHKKIIPISIRDWMTPQLLAVWYMDDGYLDRKKYPVLMTENFSINDLHYVISLLKLKFNLNCNITSKQRIRIQSASAQQFFHLIEPYIHTSLKYKLP